MTNKINKTEKSCRTQRHSSLPNKKIYITKNPISILNQKRYREKNELTKNFEDSNISKQSNKKADIFETLNCCPICYWLFPKELMMTDRNTHINKCIDGEGQQNKKKLLEKLALEHLSNQPINVQDYKKCPICNKVLNYKLEKTKLNHITDCTKEFQTRDYYMNNKKRTNFQIEY